MENFIKKAAVLIEAIPYIHAFRRKVFVIKYGGSILDDPVIRKNIFQDIIFLSYVGIRTVLVHGGGPHISSRLKEEGIKPEFHEGIRITDKETLNIVDEELEKLYEKEFYSSAKPKYFIHYEEDLPWWMATYRNYYSLLARHTTGRRLLDIGSGPGYFLKCGS